MLRNRHFGGQVKTKIEAFTSLIGQSWEKLKVIGDLGFRDLHSFNLTLLAKLAWRLLTNPDALWTTFLNFIYFPKEKFLSAKCPPQSSWSLKNISRDRELLVKGFRKDVGNRNTTNIWDDRWIPSLSNFKLYSPKSNPYAVLWLLEPKLHWKPYIFFWKIWNTQDPSFFKLYPWLLDLAPW